MPVNKNINTVFYDTEHVGNVISHIYLTVYDYNAAGFEISE